jgi:hypothetical protein
MTINRKWKIRKGRNRRIRRMLYMLKRGREYRHGGGG